MKRAVLFIALATVLAVMYVAISMIDYVLSTLVNCSDAMVARLPGNSSVNASSLLSPLMPVIGIANVFIVMAVSAAIAAMFLYSRKR